jgi:hypothetical protein
MAVRCDNEGDAGDLYRGGNGGASRRVGRVCCRWPGRQVSAAATGCMVRCLREPRFEVWTARSDHLGVGYRPGAVV